ncbi:MAG: hypothetical protein AB9856_03460 [Cellulosilyticaceae bacterium]
MVRIGEISSVNKEKQTAKVLLKDLDDMVSDDLIIVTPFGIALSEDMLPKINQFVLCVFLEDSTDGFILGSWKVD